MFLSGSVATPRLVFPIELFLEGALLIAVRGDIFFLGHVAKTAYMQYFVVGAFQYVGLWVFTDVVLEFKTYCVFSHVIGRYKVLILLWGLRFCPTDICSARLEPNAIHVSIMVILYIGPVTPVQLTSFNRKEQISFIVSIASRVVLVP